MPSGRPRSRRRFHRRALTVAAAGVVGLIAAGGFGTPSLRPIGIGLLTLGVGAIVAVEAVARNIRVTRTLDRDTLSSGERLQATVRLTGAPARRRLLDILSWEVRAGLPDLGRVEVHRPSRLHGQVVQRITISDLPRGEHRLAQPSVALADPFGLVRVRRASTTTGTVLVLPTRVPLTLPFWESGAARRAGHGSGVLRGRAELGGIREYEPGDPLSLIHWGQTARRARLQTKELHGESGRGATVLIVLDARSDPANGGKPDGPFEIAVSAAASLIAACAARGNAVGLEHAAARPAAFAVGSPPGDMERELALVEANGNQPVSMVLRAIGARAGAPRTVVVITAAGDRGLATSAGHARSAGIAVAAVLVGQARAYAQDLRRVGAWVAEAGSLGELGIVLDGAGSGAQHA